MGAIRIIYEPRSIVFLPWLVSHENVLSLPWNTTLPHHSLGAAVEVIKMRLDRAKSTPYVLWTIAFSVTLIRARRQAVNTSCQIKSAGHRSDNTALATLSGKDNTAISSQSAKSTGVVNKSIPANHAIIWFWQLLKFLFEATTICSAHDAPLSVRRAVP